ncbi:MAG TPA: hypothetical protein VK093_00045 [Candidatus Avipropionibacterium sp.]|nr:hypothetical protein [Candidatus Avipropionibacterium sp.]
MKGGNDKGIIYWHLSYKAKFRRTLWMIPLVITVIALFLVLDLPTKYTVTLSLIPVVTLLVQLIYTYKKWQDEIESEKE